MKRRNKLHFLLAMGVSLFFTLLSCKTTPPGTPDSPSDPDSALTSQVSPEDPDKAPPDKALLDELDTALGRLEEARKRAMDFDAPAYFPPEWETADGRYQTIAAGNDRNTRSDARNAVSRYDEMTAVFEELFLNSIPLYARDREQEVLEARAAALAAGAEELLPDYLIQADVRALEALDQYQREDYYPAAASAILARDLYGVLKAGTEAYAVRLEIEDRDFYHYDPDNFDEADSVGAAAVAAYGANDPAEAQYKVQEALLRYNLVLLSGKEALAVERGVFASDERQAALDLKADVAVRANFAAADAVYARAGQSLQSKDFDLAVNLYEEAEILFVRTQQDTLEKRRIAEDVIREAEEKMSESDEVARRADLILEGGMR